MCAFMCWPWLFKVLSIENYSLLLVLLSYIHLYIYNGQSDRYAENSLSSSIFPAQKKRNVYMVYNLNVPKKMLFSGSSDVIYPTSAIRKRHVVIKKAEANKIDAQKYNKSGVLLCRRKSTFISSRDKSNHV